MVVELDHQAMAGRAKTSARRKRCDGCGLVRAGFEPFCATGTRVLFCMRSSLPSNIA